MRNRLSNAIRRFRRPGLTGAGIVYDLYPPNTAALTVSDYEAIQQQTAQTLEFRRSIVENNRMAYASPGSRVSFQTDANDLRLQLYWNAEIYNVITLLATFNGVGSVLSDGVEIGTFDWSQPLVAGYSFPSYKLPTGSKTVTIVWPYSAGLQLQGIELSKGSSISSATRPSNKIGICGDSISQGFDSTKITTTWAYLVGGLQNRQVVNLANAGAPADASHANALIGTGCDRVTYLIGYNDFAAQTAIATFQSRVEGWITNARAALPTAEIYVISTIYSPNTNTLTLAQYRSAVQAAELAAGDANTFYVDGLTLMTNSTTRLSGTIHPNDLGASEIAANLDAIISGSIPAAPTGVSASPSTDGTAVAVTITWTDASTNESGFYVYRNTSNTTVGATQINSVGAGVQTYTDNSTNNPGNAPAVNTTYYYWVSAYNVLGESTKVAASQNATGGVTTLNVPAAPTSLTATATSTTQIDLAWTDNATNETGYVVERATSPGSGFWSQIATPAAGATSYSNTGLTESTQYEYRVYATNAAGNSANSNAASKFTIPATPTGLTATAASSSQIDLAWTDVSTGNTGQRIERRSPSGSGSYSTLTTVSATATTYSDTGLTASTSYEYRIVATNADYDSSPSTAANATTSAGGPTPAWSIDWSTGTPSGYTLTRASSGTYVDSSGYIASASTDVARLTHDSSGTRLGLLVEESRTNNVQYSEDFANAYWTKGLTTIDDNGGSFWTSPANASDAVLLEQVTGANEHNLRRSAITIANPCWSIFVKKQNLTTGTGRAGRYITLTIRDAASGTEYVHATFDLDAGTMTQSGTVGTNYTNRSQGIESFPNDWYRIHLTATRASASLNVCAALATTGTPTVTSLGQNYNAANSTDGVYIWGAMLESGVAVPTSYIETPSNATVTRSADLAHVLDSSITSWGDPGALVIHFYPPGQAGTLLSTDDASAAQLGLQASSTTAARAFWSNGQTSTGTIAAGVNKAVHYWSGTASSFCINGGTVQTGTNNVTTFGNIDFVTFGAEATDSSGSPGTFSQWPNLVIRKIEFYAGTLTNANLQTITT
jgi:hypothetical protein